MIRVYSIILSFGAFVVSLDQWTKNLALDHLRNQGDSIGFLSWFHFTLVHNHGAAFGVFANLPEKLRLIFFLLLPPVVLFVMWWAVVRKFQPTDKFGPITMGLVLGGALGNFIDRIRFGYVIDFIDWFYTSEKKSCIPLFYQFSPGTCHWPVFNVADSAICIAMVLLVVFSFFQKDSSQTSLKR